MLNWLWMFNERAIFTWSNAFGFFKRASLLWSNTFTFFSCTSLLWKIYSLIRFFHLYLNILRVILGKLIIIRAKIRNFDKVCVESLCCFLLRNICWLFEEVPLFSRENRLLAKVSHLIILNRLHRDGSLSRFVRSSASVISLPMATPVTACNNLITHSAWFFLQICLNSHLINAIIWKINERI